MAAVVNLTEVYNPKQSVKQVIRHIKQVSDVRFISVLMDFYFPKLE